ncbi:MAG: hypothetical protein JRI68_19445 [Deltaproteobacteria bacterium]|nr:hypothetical protein [Deltaproteobacteria bacterium]
MRKTMWLAVLGLGLALVACDQGSGGNPGTAPAKTGAPSAKADGLGGGTKHEPPIQKDEVQAGHWYCDMGTVHYTRPDEGDGKCSLCDMKLHEKK